MIQQCSQPRQQCADAAGVGAFALVSVQSPWWLDGRRTVSPDRQQGCPQIFPLCASVLAPPHCVAMLGHST